MTKHWNLIQERLGSPSIHAGEDFYLSATTVGQFIVSRSQTLTQKSGESRVILTY